jgi:hypothetical protein
MTVILVQGSYFDSKDITATKYKIYAYLYSNICINFKNIYSHQESPYKSENVLIGLVKYTKTFPTCLIMT